MSEVEVEEGAEVRSGVRAEVGAGESESGKKTKEASITYDQNTYNTPNSTGELLGQHGRNMLQKADKTF
jgi:hypothetical protein